MRLFIPRDRRVPSAIPVSVSLCNQRNGEVMTQPVAGILCNVSEGGACLELTSLLVSGHHLFYGSLKSRTVLLVIEVTLVGEEPPEFSILASSLWMRGPEPGGPAGFRIGIQFKTRQKELYRRVARKTSP